MKKDKTLRSIMLAAGFLAVISILCSQSFSYDNALSHSKAKASTEQADKQEVYINAPGDAIPGHSVQVDDSSAFHFIATLFESEDEHELPPVPAERIGYFFQVLFRTLIAPNAP